ncbi:MAG: hypothetical protein ACJ70V_08095 [Nitrososphaera sp.]|jgi:hypothetical protein
MSFVALARSGAIVSSAGVGLMVVFVITLLAFPVIKDCSEEDMKCSYRSTAPGGLQSIMQPAFLAISLLTISAGILILRFGRWLESRACEKGK